MQINSSFNSINKLTLKNNFKQMEEISIDKKQEDIKKTISENKSSEKFMDVKAELDKNVPDRTSTIEEKELAISYIDRMLACDDISDDLKTYWQNKKDVIEQEIQNIKNEKAIAKTDNSEKSDNIAKEFMQFIDKYFTRADNRNLQTQDKLEYKITYYNTYLSYCRRVLNCSDITEEQKAEFRQMMQSALRDLNNWKSMQTEYQKS